MLKPWHTSMLHTPLYEDINLSITYYWVPFMWQTSPSFLWRLHFKRRNALLVWLWVWWLDLQVVQLLVLIAVSSSPSPRLCSVSKSEMKVNNSFPLVQFIFNYQRCNDTELRTPSTNIRYLIYGDFWNEGHILMSPNQTWSVTLNTD